MIQRERKEPVLFYMKAMHFMIGKFKFLHSDWLRKIQNYTNKSIVEISDGWSMYNNLLL